MATFQKILVPTDFSECSYAASDMAAKLAVQFGASVTLLHVDEPPAWQGFVIPELVVSLPNEANTSLHEFVQTRTRRALEHLTTQLRNAGVTQVEERLEVGEPDAVILRVAEQLRCDLIVIGTHGRKGFERLMIGSVAERVVRQSSCPVLTVQVPNQEKKADSANTGGT